MQRGRRGGGELRRSRAEPGRVTAGRSGVARAADQSGDKEGYCASRER